MGIINRYTGLKRHTTNTLWVMLMHGAKLFCGFAVGLWLARYLGPEKFGIYNFVGTVLTVFTAIASFGTPDALVVDLLEPASEKKEVLRNAFYLRLGVASIIIFFLFFAWIFLQDLSAYYLFILSFILPFQSFEVIDSYFRSKTMLRRSSKVRLVQIFVTSAVRVILIYVEAPLPFFFYATVFDSMSYAMLVYRDFARDGLYFLKPIASLKELKRSAKVFFPMMIMTLASTVLMKADQTISGFFLNKGDLGNYAASSKILELLYAAPSLMFFSLFTPIVNAKKVSSEVYIRRFRRLSAFLRYGSLIFAILMYFFGEGIVVAFYGGEFLSAGKIFKVQVFNLYFYSMFLTSMYWHVAEQKTRQLMVKTILGGIFYCVSSLCLIPVYHVDGALLATFITYAIFFYFYEGLLKYARQCFALNSDIYFFIQLMRNGMR